MRKSKTARAFASMCTHYLPIGLISKFICRERICLSTNLFLFSYLADVNECLNNPCQHTCKNTFGSFTCSCHSCYTKVGLKCDLRQCKISNKCYAYGTVNPSNQCQVRWQCTWVNTVWSKIKSEPMSFPFACASHLHERVGPGPRVRFFENITGGAPSPSPRN